MEELVIYGSIPYSNTETPRRAHNPQTLVTGHVLAVYDLHSGASFQSFKKSQLPVIPARSDKTSLQSVCATLSPTSLPSLGIDQLSSPLSALSSYSASASSGPRVISATAGSASFNVYTWGRESPDQMIVVPEQMASVCLSPSGAWLAAGALNSGRIYLWETASGNLVTVREVHFQTVSHLLFSPDEAYLFSGSADSTVLGWKLVDMVRESSGSATTGNSSKSDNKEQTNTTNTGDTRPYVSWKGHLLPITGLCTGYGNASSGLKVYSSSLDKTVKIHMLGTGQGSSGTGSTSSSQLDFTFVFPAEVTALVLDPAERAFYAGLSTGSVYKVNLFSEVESVGTIESVLNKNINMLAVDDISPRSATSNINRQTSDSSSFASKLWSNDLPNCSVTSLALSFDATVLAVGSADGLVTLVDITTQTAIRTLPPREGPISSLSIVQRVKPDHTQDNTGNKGGKSTSLQATGSKTYRAFPLLKRTRDREGLERHDVWINVPDGSKISSGSEDFDDENDAELFGFDSSLQKSRKEVADFTNESSESMLKARLQAVQGDYDKLRDMYSDLSSMHSKLWELHAKQAER